MTPDLVRLSAGQTGTRPRIKVVGVGGAGCNVVAEAPLDSVVVCSHEEGTSGRIKSRCVLTKEHVRMFKTTSPQMLTAVGGNLKDGLFGGIGEADMMFLFTGLGGETGSSVTPALAHICRRYAKLVVVSAALPFAVEGGERHYLASQAMERLLEHSDMVITYANDSLLKIAPNLPLRKAFSAMDMIMMAPVIELANSLTLDDLHVVRSDFASCKRIRVGIGISGGLDRELHAVEEAFTSPWFDFDLSQVKAALVIVSASYADEKMQEKISRDVSFRLPSARVRYSGRADPGLGEKVRVLVLLGTGSARP